MAIVARYTRFLAVVPLQKGLDWLQKDEDCNIVLKSAKSAKLLGYRVTKGW